MPIPYRLSWHYFGDTACLLSGNGIDNATFRDQLADSSLFAAIQAWNPVPGEESPLFVEIRKLDAIKNRRADTRSRRDYRWKPLALEGLKVRVVDVVNGRDEVNDSVLTPDTLYLSRAHYPDAGDADLETVDISTLAGSWFVLDDTLHAGDKLATKHRAEAIRSKNLGKSLHARRRNQGARHKLGDFDASRAHGHHSYETWVEVGSKGELRLILGLMATTKDEVLEPVYDDYPCGAFRYHAALPREAPEAEGAPA